MFKNATGYLIKIHFDSSPSLLSLQSHSLTVESEAEEATRTFESSV